MLLNTDIDMNKISHNYIQNEEPKISGSPSLEPRDDSMLEQTPQNDRQNKY